MAWNNADGLHVKFGTEESTVTRAGEKKSYGQHRITQLVIEYDELGAVGTETIMDESLTLPNGAHIESAELYVETAFAGATGTLSIGLIDQDRSTAIDADGIDAAIAVAALVDDATIACDGALIGTTLTNSGLITTTNGTADFTAGRGVLTIKWYVPEKA